jgi:CRP-like cAMP-binding protein
MRREAHGSGLLLRRVRRPCDMTKKLDSDAQPFSVSDEVLTMLRAVSQPMHAEPGSYLFQEGDLPVGVYVVETGTVELYLPDHQNVRKLGRTAGPGSVLGLPACVSDKPYSLTAEVTSAARISFVSQKELQACLRNNPLICFQILQVIAQELQRIRAIPAPVS